MRKQVLTLLWTSAAAVLLAFLLGGLRRYQPPKKESRTQAESVVLLDRNAAQIDRVTVYGAKEEFTICRQDGRWTIEGYPSDLLDQRKLERSTSAAAYLSGEKVGETDSPAASWGMEEPVCRVRVEWGSESFCFLLGDRAPSLAGIYMMEEGGGSIYLSQNKDLEYLLCGPLDFFSLEIMPEITAADSRESAWLPDEVRLGGSVRQETLQLTRNADDSYKLAGPSEKTIQNRALLEILQSSGNLTADSTVEYGIKEGEYEKYGLQEPYSVMELSWTEGAAPKSCILKASALREGYCYLTRTDRDVVYRVEEKKLPWYSLQYQDLFSAQLFLPDIAEVSRIEVRGSGREEIYTIAADTDSYAISTGEQAVSARFKKLYQTLIGVPALEYAKQGPAADAEVLLTVTCHYADGRKADVLELVEGPVLSLYIRLNGEAEFLTRKDWLDIILWNMDHLMTEDKLLSFY